MCGLATFLIATVKKILPLNSTINAYSGILNTYSLIIVC